MIKKIEEPKFRCRNCNEPLTDMISIHICEKEFHVKWSKPRTGRPYKRKF
jgi:hypothetical protein